MTCPRCSADARCNGLRPRKVLSLLGTLSFRRHYYHCRACKAGTFPFDDLLHLRHHDLTPAADKVVCTAGVLGAFGEAATKSLPSMSNLRVSESTGQRATEDAGARLTQRRLVGKAFGPVRPWVWHKDAEGKTVAYVSVDATGVAQQGPNGAEAEGRMACVGMVYNPVPEDRSRWANPKAKRRPAWESRYVARVRSLVELGEPLRKLAGAVGMNQAERWVALSDGGSGVEDFLGVNFGRLVAIILDFWHAAEYLGEMARALYPSLEEAREAWLALWCHRLKWEGGPKVLKALKELDKSGWTKAAQEAWQEVERYYTNQGHRMDYPSYLAKGWQIGSGPIESACKTVVVQRLCQGGMRWGVEGSDQVSHLRALFRSELGPWEYFWDNG
jgi:hypothetical protein